MSWRTAPPSALSNVIGCQLALFGARGRPTASEADGAWLEVAQVHFKVAHVAVSVLGDG